MSKSDKFLVGGVVLAAGIGFVVNLVTCWYRKGWHLEPGQPDECLPPAMRSGLMAGAFSALRVHPLVQLGFEALQRRANTPTGEPHLLDISGRPLWLQMPGETGYDAWPWPS